MTDRKALPDIPRSPATHKAFDVLWRNPLRPETIIDYITAREADIRAWVDANYVRKKDAVDSIVERLKAQGYQAGLYADGEPWVLAQKLMWVADPDLPSTYHAAAAPGGRYSVWLDVGGSALRHPNGFAVMVTHWTLDDAKASAEGHNQTNLMLAAARALKETP